MKISGVEGEKEKAEEREGKGERSQEGREDVRGG